MIHSKQLIKPKFHYADFMTFTETSPRVKSQTQIRDANPVSYTHLTLPTNREV